MRKLKVILMSIAVVAAISSAFANKPKLFCEDFPQYYRGFSGWTNAGEFGVDYVCNTSVGICTYYRPSPLLLPNTYLPCRFGFIELIFLKKGGAEQARASR